MATVSALLDTNVLIYATVTEDPRYPIARALLLGEQSPAGGELFISVQNLAEMWPNLTGPKLNPPDSPAVARAKIESIARLPHLTVLPVDWDTVRHATQLCEERNVRRQDYFDMQLVAVMRQHRIRRIYTENAADFKGLDGIEAVNPFAKA